MHANQNSTADGRPRDRERERIARRNARSKELIGEATLSAERFPNPRDLPWEWFYPPTLERLKIEATKGILLLHDLPDDDDTKRLCQQILDALPTHPRLQAWFRYQRSRPQFAGGFIGPVPTPETIGRQNGRPAASTLFRPPRNQPLYFESYRERDRRIEREIKRLADYLFIKRLAARIAATVLAELIRRDQILRDPSLKVREKAELLGEARSTVQDRITKMKKRKQEALGRQLRQR